VSFQHRCVEPAAGFGYTMNSDVPMPPSTVMGPPAWSLQPWRREIEIGGSGRRVTSCGRRYPGAALADGRRRVPLRLRRRWEGWHADDWRRAHRRRLSTVWFNMYESRW